MAKVDPYTDKVLGIWRYDGKISRESKKFCFKRQATLKLHKDHAQDYYDPKTGEKKIIHGEVVLTEVKMIDKENSDVGIFREIEATAGSIILDVLK